MHHRLKILPCYFKAVIEGKKKFEIRDNSDRGFQVGDTVTLSEFDPYYEDTWSGVTGYTGKEYEVLITYVTNYNQKPEFVVFEFEELAQ